jgi:hypothetical protein
MKNTLAVADAAAPGAPAGEAGPEHLSVQHSGTFYVDAPPWHAFRLFTAPGERLWVPGWEATYPGGGDGRERGAVWLTGHNGEQTIWVVIDYDPDAFHARYARVTPGSRAGTVEVRLRPDDDGGSTVEVTYVLTGLSEHGDEVLAGFDEASYADMMHEWERLIREADIEYPLPFAESE